MSRRAARAAAAPAGHDYHRKGHAALAHSPEGRHAASREMLVAQARCSLGAEDPPLVVALKHNDTRAVSALLRETLHHGALRL